MSAYEWHHDNFEMSVLLLLGFDCLLRTGELLSLTADDFQLGRTAGVISLRNTKSGIRFNANEAISITNPLVLETLRLFISVRRQLGTTLLPLWSSSPALFRSRFKELCNIMDLSHHAFRPYSLRRGGATAFFQQTKSMEASLLRGRWESSRVAKLYISDALSYLPSIKLSPKTVQFMQQYSF